MAATRAGPVALTNNSDISVVDGPDGKMATGYSMIKADSLDTATSLAKGCPILDGGGNISRYVIFGLHNTNPNSRF